MYPASHKAGRKKLCRPELALNAMPMSTLIWTRTRAKLCLVKNVERTWRLLDSIPSSWTLSKRRSTKTRTKTNSDNADCRFPIFGCRFLLPCDANDWQSEVGITYSPLDTQSGFVANLTH